MFGDLYFSFDGSFSFLIFYLQQKKEENLLLWEVWIFLQHATSNSIVFSSNCFSVQQFQRPLEGLSLRKYWQHFDLQYGKLYYRALTGNDSYYYGQITIMELRNDNLIVLIPVIADTKYFLLFLITVCRS